MPQTVDEAASKVFGHSAENVDRAQRFLPLGCEVVDHPKVVECAQSYADMFMFCAPERPDCRRAHLEGLILAAIMSGVQLGIEMEKSA